VHAQTSEPSPPASLQNARRALTALPVPRARSPGILCTRQFYVPRAGRRGVYTRRPCKSRRKYLHANCVAPRSKKRGMAAWERTPASLLLSSRLSSRYRRYRLAFPPISTLLPPPPTRHPPPLSPGPPSRRWTTVAAGASIITALRDLPSRLQPIYAFLRAPVCVCVVPAAVHVSPRTLAPVGPSLTPSFDLALYLLSSVRDTSLPQRGR